MATLYILIPIYNESENISKLAKDLSYLLKRIRPVFQIHLILIDDGSTDDTPNQIGRHFQSLPHTTIRYRNNHGPGHAFAGAFASIAKCIRNTDWIFTMEGDNTSKIETLLHMLKRSEEGYDVVLASPYQYGGGFSYVNGIRIFISHMGNGMVKLFLGLRGFHTFSSFLRLIKGQAFHRLQEEYGKRIIESNGFECMVEWLIKMVKIHLRISEVEMQLDWSMRKGKSKIKIFKTTLGYFRLFYILNKKRNRL